LSSAVWVTHAFKKKTIIMSDKELRARVKLFGNLLGNVLHAHAGERVFFAVETLRTGHIALQRRRSGRKRQELAEFINTLDPDTLTHVVRAFSAYFSLVNIAEEAYQHRQRRLQVRAGGPLWTGSFDATLHEFHDQGMTPQQLQGILNRLAYIPVITAHPTESKRRTIMEALRRIFVTSERLDDPRVGPSEREEIITLLKNQIQVLWKTDEVRVNRPTVSDEIKNGLYYFQESLFKAVPTMYRYLEKAIQKTYAQKNAAAGHEATPIHVPSFMRFGSWIGGDRDGNPNVTPETTILALRLQTRAILLEYIGRITHLSRGLTHSVLLCQPSLEFLDSLKRDEQFVPATLRDTPLRFINEPYRRKLYVMRHRLECNLVAVKARLDNKEIKPLASRYTSEQELLDDLYVTRDSLASHGDEAIANGDLKDLIRLVETFGFFLCHLDLRQESTRHTRACSELFAKQTTPIDYESLSEKERMAVLTDALNQVALQPGNSGQGSSLITDTLSAETRQTLEVFSVMAKMRHEISAQAFGCYVISMTHAASHVMEVMWLAHQCGLVGYKDSGWFCDIRISPLFETINDLAHVEQVLTGLLDNPVYAELLKVSGHYQEVMLGYSDSCKDGGILASSWYLYEAQKKIIAITAERNIECRLFHGRGGTAGRGGGPTHESILAQPSSTVFGQIKFTEQGEVLSYRYSNTETAVYELSMGITGLLKASRHLITRPAREGGDGSSNAEGNNSEIMAQLAHAGEGAYRQLTDRTPGFLDYFYEATPVREIGLLNIGSRPSHRNKSDRSKSSVRAIAWVFGWAQSRHTLPAWFGLGTALATWRAGNPKRLVQLRALYRNWPFFRAMLSNTQMALSKADMSIAREYAALCNDPDTCERVYAMIRDEYEKTVQEILDIAELSSLLEENPALALSLKRRNPYLNPLNHIQVTLLKRYRDLELAEHERTIWLDPLLRSINAIAAGMRNTG
jgi:phosphoenolpyruvate carboxylase